MSERTIFIEAVQITDPAAQGAYLDRACGDDPALRERVDALLAAHAQADSLLDPHPDATHTVTTPSVDADATRGADDTGTIDPARTRAGDEVPGDRAPEPGLLAGRYKLLEPLGEGGMGTVYRAEQLHPVRRMVAVKLIKAGTDTARVIARFEAERQALAVMDHPHIARVLDGGVTGTGQPFFVMELVAGVPITAYADGTKLTVPQRLELFTAVCAAVQHAHQKGIIHRDLKPGNVLVTEVDGKPVPKVIDFGLAKALQAGAIPDVSLEATGFGSVLGTPLYMAPEQADPGTTDIDTRADVYALGVILYELLTGSTPHTRESFRKVALSEVLRMVREVDPPTPGQRLESSDALAGIAAVRGAEPGKLGRLVRGDLEWVTMKALAKERERRYESATALAADVERFLNHEPVTAGPPSRWYRARKFVRRNRGAVTAAGVVLLALVAGVIGTTLGLLEADAQRRHAQGQELKAKGETAEKEKARVAEEESRKELEVAFASRQYDDVMTVEGPRGREVLMHHLLRLLKTLPEHAHELRFHTKLQIALEVAQHGVWPRQARAENVETRFRFQSNEVICTRADGTLALADPITGRRRVTFSEPGVRLRYLAHSESGDVLVAVDESIAPAHGSNGTHPFYFFDTATGRLRGRTSAAYGSTDPLDLSRDGTRLLTRTGLGSVPRPGQDPIELWDTGTGRKVCGLPPTAVVANLSPDGRFIVAYRSGKIVGPRAPISVYSATDGHLVHTIPGTEREYLHAAVTPSGQHLVSFTTDQVRWWRTDDWTPVGQPSKTENNQMEDLLLPDGFGERRNGFQAINDVRYFVRDSVAVLCGRMGKNNGAGFLISGRGVEVFARGQPEPAARLDSARLLYLTDSGAVLDTGQFVGVDPVRVTSPGKYRRYADDARAFAVGGRFMDLTSPTVTAILPTTGPDAPEVLSINFASEKPLTFGVAPIRLRGRDYYLGGSEGFHWSNGPLLVPASVGEFDPDLLALCVGVTTFGELTEANGFQPWDDATWEAKRAELARRIVGRPEAELMTCVAEDRSRGTYRRIRETTDKAEAVALLERLTREEPYYLPHLVLARLRAQAGDLTAAAADLREALRRYRQSPGRLHGAVPLGLPDEPHIDPVTALALATDRPAADYELVREWVAHGPAARNESLVAEQARQSKTDDALARYRLGQYRELEAELYPKASADLAKLFLPLAFAPHPLGAAVVVRGRASVAFAHEEMSRPDATILAMCEFRLGRADIAKRRLLDQKYRAVPGPVSFALMKEAYTLVGLPLPKLPN